MVILVLTEHLRLRLRIRKIPNRYPQEIYNSPDFIFFDVVEQKGIAIKKLQYNKKIRNMMIAYEEKGQTVEIITIHPITEEKIINRVINGRWRRKHG